MRAAVCFTRAALGLAVTLSACGTLSGRTQRVAVDASPRGGAVRDATRPEAHPLASTPAVVELERARTQTLVFEPPPAAEAGDAPAPKVVEVDCDFRWRVAGLGNTPFLLLTLAQFGVGYVLAVGVDLATGAAWDCPLLVRPPGIGTESARRLFVLPPDHDDVAVQDALVESFAAAVRPSLGPDETVLTPRENRALLERIGAPRRLAMLPRHRLNTLLAGTGATHVVSLRWRTDDTGTVFSGEQLDGYRGGITPVVGVEGPRVETPDGFSWQTLFQYLHFIPNSVAWLPGAANFTAAPRRGRTVENTPRVSLPSYLSGWTLTSADHPDAFDAWDLHGRLEPTVGLSFLDADVRLRGGEALDGAPLEDADARFGAWIARAYYELGGAAHTPFGAFDLALLGGYGVARQAAFAGSPSFWQGRVEFGLGFKWTAFLTERVFARLSVTSFSPRSPMLQTRDFRVETVTQGTLGLGVYLPETRWWLRSLFAD